MRSGTIVNLDCGHTAVDLLGRQAGADIECGECRGPVAVAGRGERLPPIDEHLAAAPRFHVALFSGDTCAALLTDHFGGYNVHDTADEHGNTACAHPAGDHRLGFRATTVTDALRAALVACLSADEPITNGAADE